MALKAYVATDTSGFAPSVGQLIEKVRLIEQPYELNEMEAWSLVSKALRNGSYGAVEEFAKLPPVVQKAVGSASQLKYWATTEGESVENVIQSNFMRAYRSVLVREKEMNKMPSDVMSLINNTLEKQQLEMTQRKGIEVKEDYGERTGNIIPMPESAKKRFAELFN